MTAEIAIINRQAIAIAADSAVTIGKDRVWKNSNKLFSLAPSNDIAVMFYGSAEFSGFSWEAIIKIYRLERGSRQFDTVAQCASDISEFIKGERFKPDLANRVANYSVMLDELGEIKLLIGSYSRKAEFRSQFMHACEMYRERFDDISEIPDHPSYTWFDQSYSELIQKFMAELTGEVITSAMKRELSKSIFEYLRKGVGSKYETGVVVIGYGKKELFPSFVEYTVDGRFADFTRIWVSNKKDCNRDEHPKVLIQPFAQYDIFHLFMEGIDPTYMLFLDRYFNRILDSKSEALIKGYISDIDEKTVETARQQKANRKIMEKFREEFLAYRRENVVDKILDVVRALPKEEMADMALALVELTSLRRKVDSRLESVGGPVDVAVISKGDGLIWMQRKHYFDIDKNRDFLYRKFGREGVGDV